MLENLKTPNDGSTLFKYSFGVFAKALFSTILLAACLIGLKALITHGPNFVPEKYKEQVDLGIMFAYLAMLPIFGLIALRFEKVIQQSDQSFKDQFVRVIVRFVSLLGCLISMALIPLIIFLVGFSSYFGLVHFKTPAQFLFFLFPLVYILIFMQILPKIFAPFLTVANNMDTHEAVETSMIVSKGFYKRNLLYSGFSITLLLGTFILPHRITYYLPQLKNTLPSWGPEAITAGLFLIILPWVMALMMCHKHDLYLRYAAKLDQVKDMPFMFDHKIKKPLGGRKDHHDDEYQPPEDHDERGF